MTAPATLLPTRLSECCAARVLEHTVRGRPAWECARCGTALYALLHTRDARARIRPALAEQTSFPFPNERAD